MMDALDVQVSVIIPTCRRIGFLRAAVASVLAQSLPVFELIIVDDDPAASAKDLAVSFHDARIVYLAHGKNRGAGAARNTGLSHARGRYIAFLDDDDVWHKDFLIKMVAAMESLPARVGVLHCAHEQVDGRGRVSVHIPRHRGDVHAVMLRGEKSSGIIGLIRREALEACQGFDETLPSAQDWDLWIRVSKAFYFDYITDVLVTVRLGQGRISSDGARAAAARWIILEKYADEFARDPQARAIHEKRLGKLYTLAGQWKEGLRWLSRGAAGSMLERAKVLAWLVFVRPFLASHETTAKDYWYAMGAFIISFFVVVYSQSATFLSMYVVNDDMCQHIWWMRLWRDPGLFQNDLLARYAQSLQNFGILALYRVTGVAMDPVALVKALPLILFPLASWAMFRLVFTWTRDGFTSFLTTCAFMVTPVYLQHMAGGHAHTFGYTLLLLFLYFFSVENYTGAAAVMLAGALFFPVVPVLGAVYWLYAFCRWDKGAVTWRGPKIGEKMLLMGALAAALVMGFKFLFFNDPVIGAVLGKDAVARMPELTAAGRWAVWPVPAAWDALVAFAENGVFIFKAGFKISSSQAWRDVFLSGHFLWGFCSMAAGAWWWRKRREVHARGLVILVAVSVLLYVFSAGVVLKLYAPDRYMAYPVTLAGLIFLMVPLGMTLSSWPQQRVRRVLKVVMVLTVLAWIPLTKGAGLKDYAAHKKLYAFLGTLPKDALIAAWPDTADGVPLFSRRSVFINEEMSVPLFDHYWETIRTRTFDFLNAYYAGDRRAVVSFFRRNGITHLVIERARFSADFLKGNIYFEPFGSWVKDKVLRGRRDFYLEDRVRQGCLFTDGDVCVLDAGQFERQQEAP